MSSVRILFAFLVLAAVSYAQQTAPANAKPAPNPSYTELVKRLRSGDLAVDFRQLRLAYAEEEGGYPRDVLSDQERAMFAAFRGERWQEALDAATKLLDRIYVEKDAHFVAYACYHELRQPEKAEFHRAVLSGLLRSMMVHGDGKSFDSALEVIDVHEEYEFLRFNGLRPGRQSLVRKDGHSYDMLETTDQQGSSVMLYFNVDIPMARASKAPGP